MFSLKTVIRNEIIHVTNSEYRYFFAFSNSSAARRNKAGRAESGAILARSNTCSIETGKLVPTFDPAVGGAGRAGGVTGGVEAMGGAIIGDCMDCHGYEYG